MFSYADNFVNVWACGEKSRVVDEAKPKLTSGQTDAVAIGRNEGRRLADCLASLTKSGVRRIFYVDSGSTDGSVAAAEAMGAHVVLLDMDQPFTAARARNAGLAAVMEQPDPPEFVHFIDGDCVMQADWLPKARDFLERDREVVVVCGRRRERHPHASVYNRLCDREWDTPVGEARACGGDALMRAAAVVAAGGYRADLIAGEEPELCVRLRQAGGRIYRLDAEMTLHDAAMMRFGQWWRRSQRAGHAFAEGAALHGRPPELHWVAETRRALIWGAALPAMIVLCLPFFPSISVALALIYPAQLLRLAARGGLSRREAWQDALFSVLGKFAEARGALGYYADRLRGRRAGLIEYK